MGPFVATMGVSGKGAYSQFVPNIEYDDEPAGLAFLAWEKALQNHSQFSS